MTSGLLDPIPTPPRCNEHRSKQHGWMRYPRAALSSLLYNVSGVVILHAHADQSQEPMAALIMATLLHVMGLASLLNWTQRNELSRLLDISCMLMLKCHFIALAVGLEKHDDAVMLAWTTASIAMAVTLVFVLRLADNNKADLLMAPFIAVLLVCEYVFRPPLLLDPPEGMLLFVAGYLCKLADLQGVWQHFLWWTALFHALTAYVMALAGLELRGANGKRFIPHVLPDGDLGGLMTCLGAAGVGCCVVVASLSFRRPAATKDE